jgi:hypothetical protein
MVPRLYENTIFLSGAGQKGSALRGINLIKKEARDRLRATAKACLQVRLQKIDEFFSFAHLTLHEKELWPWCLTHSALS